ncbi:MAG: MBL fold metallo-hydrolase [Actinomycetota bacterium]|nr:MBL fold metallo-hydrolase [Actinomycetota bacterium]
MTESTDLPVRRVEIPTPYAVGPVNAYLIEAEPLTLIDAGVNTPEGEIALIEGLAEGGRRVEDLERVLITHAHPDHYGLVHIVQERSGAAVYFPEREIARVRDRQMLFEVGRLLVQAGMPLELLFKMDQARKKDPRPGIRHDEVVLVHDGDAFDFDEGSRLRAHFLPGHTGGHVVYLEEQSRVLFAGDQLLPEVSPNPLLEPSLDEPGERRRSLKEYLGSLDALLAMDPALVYPGHGDPVHDPGALIRRTIEHHHARKAEVAAMLDGSGKTPYELAMQMYPDVSGYEAFLAVSEVVAHLDLVVEEEKAVVKERDGVTFYQKA